MKEGAKEIPGKTIRGVVITTGPDEPASQLFLVFEDGTYYEFYSATDIRPTGGVDPGDLDRARKYIGQRNEIAFEAYPKLLC